MKKAILFFFFLGILAPFSTALSIENLQETIDGNAAAKDASASKKIIVPVLKTEPTLNGKIQAETSSCNFRLELSDGVCQSSSPALQKYSALIGILISGVGTVRSMSDACSDYGKALKLAEQGITAFNTACSSAQGFCESSCISLSKQLDAAQKYLLSLKETALLAEREGLITNPTSQMYVADLASIATGRAQTELAISVCEKYKLNLAAAGMGLTRIVKSAAVAKTCENKTTTADCKVNPSAPGCSQSVDCSKPENESVPQCICEKKPNTAGCPGAVADSGLAPANRGEYTGPSADKTNDKINPDFSKGSDAGINPQASAGAGGGSGSNPSSGGGGGGLGGADNGSGKGTDSKSQKGLNPNILSGYDGGGGGGGMRGSSGRDPMNSAYQAYMPGGSKDPTRGLASKTFGNGEVTTAGSKSNWEKVSERYKDNKPTLVGP